MGGGKGWNKGWGNGWGQGVGQGVGQWVGLRSCYYANMVGCPLSLQGSLANMACPDFVYADSTKQVKNQGYFFSWTPRL